MSERPEVYEPWRPQAGMWVRVRRGPECRAFHSMLGGAEDGAYGRIEWIDREWDSPSAWRAAYEQDGELDSVADADEDARRQLGHYYCVQDVLDTGRVTILDGFYCAAELVQVSEIEALAGIAEARLALSYLTPGARLRRALLGAADGR